MQEIKAGQKLRSAVCDTQVIVIKAIPGDHELSCGGAAMIGLDSPASVSTVAPAMREGTLLGKRYVDESEALELLCVKAGEGTLALDGVALGTKQPKALPSSD